LACVFREIKSFELFDLSSFCSTAYFELEHMNEIAVLRSAIELLGTEKAELEEKFAKKRTINLWKRLS